MLYIENDICIYICENHVQTTNNKYFGQMITFHPGTGHDNLTVFRLSWVLSHFQTAVYFWSPKGENVTSRNQLINVDGFFVASDWNSNWGILKFRFLNSFSRCTRWFFVVKGNRLWHEWTWFFRWIPTKIWKFLFLKFQARGCHENSPTCFHEKNHPTETPLVTWKGPDSNKDFSDLQPELVFGLFLQLVNCPFSQAELIWLCQSSKQILLTTAATEITIRGRMEDREMKKLFFWFLDRIQLFIHKMCQDKMFSASRVAFGFRNLSNKRIARSCSTENECLNITIHTEYRMQGSLEASRNNMKQSRCRYFLPLWHSMKSGWSMTGS